MTGIKIEYNEDQIFNMSDTEKLNVLVKIGLANRRDLDYQHKILCGNGDPDEGLCAKMLSTSLHIKGLWASLIGGGGIIIGVLANLIMK